MPCLPKGRRVFASVCHALAVATIAGPALATATLSRAADTAADYAGSWTLDSEFSDAACTLLLDSARAGAGHRIGGLESCRASFPVLTRVAAWQPRGEDGLAFVDDGGNIVVDYAFGEMDALLSVEPQHVFQRLTAIRLDNDPVTVGSIEREPAR